MKWRKIVVKEVEWIFHVGKMFVVARNDKSVKVGMVSEVKKMSIDTIERGRHKKTSDGMITPAHVANWIGSQ